ncbi:Hpt domain-containing protein [Desulfovibrio sp. OttesenSCG-928-F20]|nr:Hpt domain-containing protein [Desulfovibrio sp. OttesenSCG-928-F20]
MKDQIAKTSRPGVLLNLAEALERMGNDQEVYCEIAHYFAENLPKSLQCLMEALDRDEAETARRIAHSLKSNCATVGAEYLRSQCYNLEVLCRSGELAKARDCYVQLMPQLMHLRDALLDLKKEMLCQN